MTYIILYMYINTSLKLNSFASFLEVPATGLEIKNIKQTHKLLKLE